MHKWELPGFWDWHHGTGNWNIDVAMSRYTPEITSAMAA